MDLQNSLVRYYDKKWLENLKASTPFEALAVTRGFDGQVIERQPPEPDHVCPNCGHGFDCDRDYQ